MVTVPKAYQQYVQQAAQGTGLPYAVVAAQAQAESNFNASAVSTAGAEGWLQFLPSTYNAYAPMAGVPQNTEFNVADETKVYIAYMNDLLKQEGGSIFKALEAYNAGPHNLAAGSGYASSILQTAGVSQSATAGTGAGVNVVTTGIHIPGTGITIPTSPSDFASLIFGGLLKALGIPDLKDLFQRLALILLGVALLLVGIRILTQQRQAPAAAQPQAQAQKEREEKPAETQTETEAAPSTEVLTPTAETGGAAGGAAAGGVGATEAMEAAIIA